MTFEKRAVLFFLSAVAFFSAVIKAKSLLEDDIETNILTYNSTTPREIEDINCKEVCGENSEVVCIKKDEEIIKCLCKNEDEDFDEDEKECKINYCKVKCKDVKCLGNMFEEDVTCLCSRAYEDFDEKTKKCKINYCKKICGTFESVKCEAEDEYKNVNLKSSCTDEDYVFKDKKCIQKCSEDADCNNEGTCVGREGEKVCKCKPGTIGDFCETIIACEEGGQYEKCRDGKGDCKYIGGKAVCECTEENQMFSEEGGYCAAQCGKNKKCGDNSICNKDNFCLCKEGYEGKDCSVVTGCKGYLGRICEELGVYCIFDENSPVKATCNCGKGLKYDPKDRKCKHKFCYPVNRCKPAYCTFDKTIGVVYCQCPENQFYSYEAGKCKDFENKCLLRKKPCGENEECDKKTGQCKCKYSLEKGKECKRKFCYPNPCFKRASCSENEKKCFCEKEKYYKDKECKRVTCNFKEYERTCTCPEGTKRYGYFGECVTQEREKCENKTEEDCGYGICKKVNKKDSCKCFTFAENNKALNGKCTLKKEFCASGVVNEIDQMKCECHGIYKQAADGITCTLKTCDDEGVKEECNNVGGKCVMKWKGYYVGYDCICPEGYVKDIKGKCTDPCSDERINRACTDKGQVCYNSFSFSNRTTTSCKCPPTVELVNGKCEGMAANAYMFKNIPVLKEKYESESGINKVLLNKHLVESLQETFRKDIYDFGYLFDYELQGNIVYCFAWVNFRYAPTDTELKRIKIASKTFSNVCDDCDDGVMIWPPNLFLSETGLEEVIAEKQSFCKVKNRLCGKGAKCTEDKKGNGKCSCDEGYQAVQYGILKIGPHEAQICEDINECALGIDKCPGNTRCFNTIGSYSCICKEGYKKLKTPADPETDKSDCVDLCTPNPCKKGKCVLKEKEKTFDCLCEPGVAGIFCDRFDENYKSVKKITIIVGAVLGSILAILAVVAIAAIYYIFKIKKKYGSDYQMPARRSDHTEMAQRRQIHGVTNEAYFCRR